jgi:ATP-binding cassette subfamily C protein CydD
MRMRNRKNNARTNIPRDWLGEWKALTHHVISASVILRLLSAFLFIVQAWFLARVVHGLVIDRLGLSQALPWMWLLLAVFLLRAFLAWLSEQASFLASARVKETIRNRLVRHVHALGPEYLYGKRTGDLANTLIDAVEALEPYYARYLPQASLAALVPLCMLVFVLGVDSRSALVLAISGPLIPLFMIIIGKGAERLNQKQWKKLAWLSAHFLDVIQGLTTLKLFNVSREEAKVVAQVSDEYHHSVMAVLRVAFLSSLALEFCSTLGVAMVAVLLGFRLLWGGIDFQSAFFVLLLAPEFFLPLRKLGASYHARMEAIGAAQGIVAVLNTPVSIPTRGTKTLKTEGGLHVVFQDVRFAYEGNRVALSGFNLRINPAETLALVGPSGSGKSTVSYLLLNFLRAQKGTITVNGTNLYDLAEDHWLSNVAWVPQRPHMFHGTIGENIRLGRPDADMDRVIEAARRAGADAFIRDLPLGYETPIGEGGRALSGGQRQLITIARAFLKDVPLMILDEATANLDPETQEQTQKALAALAHGRSALIIAHRLSTVRMADRIATLIGGRVVEEGSHEELLALEGPYSRMIKAYRTAV